MHFLNLIIIMRGIKIPAINKVGNAKQYFLQKIIQNKTI